jgi:co-chaperonin GroES (HSP10)
MDISNVKVAGHRVLLEPVFPEETTESGIIIATHSEHKRERAATDTGRVVNVGNTCWNAFDKYTPDGKRNPSWEPWCKPGDLVIFAKYGGKFLKVDGKDYGVVLDEDIQCVVQEDDNE